MSSRFDARAQALIEAAINAVVDDLSRDKVAIYPLPKPQWSLWMGSTKPGQLLISNQGVEYQPEYERPDRQASAVVTWNNIVKFGVMPVGSPIGGAGTYLYMTVRKPDGGTDSVVFAGTTIRDQILLVALQHVHERKVGRYIYPRLKPQSQVSTGERLLRGVSGWEDEGRVPLGEPPPILIEQDTWLQLWYDERFRRLTEAAGRIGFALKAALESEDRAEIDAVENAGKLTMDALSAFIEMKRSDLLAEYRPGRRLGWQPKPQ